ncbi:hypothetical protein T08_11631 [Trichinella sp. T8]|nr:hypothetical protein T08_11631 [Trichinella sp. T8]
MMFISYYSLLFILGTSVQKVLSVALEFNVKSLAICEVAYKWQKMFAIHNDSEEKAIKNSISKSYKQNLLNWPTGRDSKSMEVMVAFMHIWACIL